MPKIKVCPKCGIINDGIFATCKKCGADLSNVEKMEVPADKLAEIEKTEISAGGITEAIKAELELEKRFAEKVEHMLLTTGFDFQGYRITDYYDVVFDELFVGMGFLKSISVALNNFGAAIMGDEATKVGEKLNAVKIALRDRVKLKAARMGANALIGIDFESSKVGDLIMVSMTATAVKIEKIQ